MLVLDWSSCLEAGGEAGGEMCGNLQMDYPDTDGRAHTHTHTQKKMRGGGVALACQQRRLMDGGICVGWREEKAGEL